MAETRRAPGGAPGDWFVDDRCIDCGASRHVAPGLIVAHEGGSVFSRQPRTAEEQHAAWLAAELCPTRSVRTESRLKAPEGVYPHELAPGIYLCGYNARASYGAHSYFVKRPEGNILVDSPSFVRKLVRSFEELGGIRTIFLSHRDDVADADQWASHFHADVFIHREDRRAAPYATHVVEGAGPAETTEIGPGLRFIPLPGHTAGSAALLVDGGALFTGDSLCWVPDQQRLHAFRNACWYSWPVQKQSLAALAAHEFGQVFSGHGSWSPWLGVQPMREHLLALVAKM